MSPEIAVLIGVVAGSAGTWIVTWITTRAEERKHHRALVYQAGIENFKEACVMARHNKGSSRIPPMEDFIINMSKIATLLADNPNFNSTELTKMLEDSHRVAKQLSDFRFKDE